MYFGSVKFFKHLIVTFIMLLIVILIASVVILANKNSNLRSDLERLYRVINGNTPGNEENISSPQNDYNDPVGNVVPTDTTPAEPVWPPEPVGLYGNILPELYAESNYYHQNDDEYIQDNNYIYLTFDDGPSSNTSVILDYLKNYEIPATFFVIPSETSEALLSRINNEGHAIGVHSYTHDYSVIYTNVENFLEDFNTARNLIYEQTGVLTDFFRFPGGSVNSHNDETRDSIIDEMARRGFVYFDWDIDSGDIRGASWDSMYRTVREEVAGNTELNQRSIILFHDSSSANRTTWVIGDLIEYFQKNPAGYIFGKIDINVRPFQW